MNRTLVKNYFGSDDPIGRQIKFNVLDEIPRTPHNAYFEIIGVVNDFRNYGLQESTHLEAYTPYTFTGFGDRSLVVRTSVNPMSLVNNIRQAVSAVDGNVVLNHPGTIDDFLQKNVYMKPKFRLISFGACAAIGLGLALIGLFGVMAYSVTLQTHDFGVRMALGAQSSSILSLVIRRGLGAGRHWHSTWTDSGDPFGPNRQITTVGSLRLRRPYPDHRAAGATRDRSGRALHPGSSSDAGRPNSRSAARVAASQRNTLAGPATSRPKYSIRGTLRGA